MTEDLHQMADMKAAAIITAGGLGKRFGEIGEKLLPKQFVPLSTKPLILYSIQSFELSKFISEIVLVVPDKWVEYTETELVNKFNFKKISKVIPGGAERQESVERGFKSLSSETEIVAVHDGVRPFVSLDIIEKVLKEAANSGGAIAAIPATDTIKKSGSTKLVKETLSREDIWFAQTPQAFKYEILLEAYEKASEDGYIGTDEAELVERLGKEVKIVIGSKNNIKITTPEDLKLGELILDSGMKDN